MARAECPASTITAKSNFSPTVTHTTSAPRDAASRHDEGTSCPDYCYSWGVDVHAQYDLVAGNMSAEAYGSGAGVGEGSASTHDVFTLLGPSAAPPIPFHARAHVGVASGCGYGPDAEADASIREGASNSASVTASGHFQNCTGPLPDIGVSITRG